MEGGENGRELVTLVRDAATGTARRAGTTAVASGRWMADVLVDVAPRIPIRRREVLERHHDGLTGDALARALTDSAGRTSAAIGGTAGAMVAAQELAPPAWVAIPFELVIETLAVAAVELKLVAEIHEAMGQPITGAVGERAGTLLQAWAHQRGVSVRTLSTPRGVADALGRSTRNEIVRLVRRRILRRLGRNMATIAPMLVGAAAGAHLNRKATRALGEKVVADLADGDRS